MLISQFFILSPRGDKLIFKDYRQEVPRNSDEILFRRFKFWDGAMHQAPAGDCPPFFVDKGITFCFLRVNGLIIACTTIWNVSPSMLSEMLSRFCKIIRDFLGFLTEEAIRKNFVMVYEILDEMIDVGVIQEMSSEKLRPYIFNDPLKVENPETSKRESFAKKFMQSSFFESTKRSTAAAKSIILGSKEHKNEIYIDIIERLNCTFSSSGSIINSEVDGAVVMKSFLQGTPDLYVGFNEDLVVGRNSRAKYSTVCLDSINFHESADYSRFEADRQLMMHPPDGEFTVMNYRLTGDSFSQPFHIVPSLELQSTYKAELSLRVRGDFAATTVGINVVVRCPVPKNTTSIGVELGIGASGQTYEYQQAERLVIWKFKKFAGNTEHLCKIRISTGSPFTPGTRKEIGPISMGFEIPMHNVSGLAIKFLRLEERSHTYNPQRWVRSITQANSYVCRMT